jgi:hypothetical protein
MHNFRIGLEEILRWYPLDLVREIHISGGSWEESSIELGEKVRRDTHDVGVPEEVFQMLEKTIPLCSHLQYVVLEQIGSGLSSEQSKVTFRTDYKKMKAIIKSKAQVASPELRNSFLPNTNKLRRVALQDEDLHHSQMLLSEIIEETNDYDSVVDALQQSALAKSEWNIESWEPKMIETLVAIAQKWKNGF